MNVAFINPFITACREVFDTMIHVPISLGKPHLKDPAMRTFKVGAMVGISGGAEGMVLIGLTERVAMALVAGLTGSDCESLDADALDALGEIANMITGSAKKGLPGGLSKMTVPKIVTADKPPIYPEGLPVIVVPFDTGAGRFVIEVSLKTVAPVKTARTEAPATAPSERTAPAEATAPTEGAAQPNPPTGPAAQAA